MPVITTEHLDAIAAFEGRCAKIEGVARTGKTEALVRRCVVLIEQGVDPRNIFVATASACAADSFRIRLSRALPEVLRDKIEQLCITTALDCIVGILNEAPARAATGRVPRLLTTGEYSFLLEDMKTLGTSIRTLRSMLGYFYRLLCDLEPRSTWNLGGSEETVWNHLVNTLSSRHSMLPQEAGAICANYLRSDEGSYACARFAYVFSDDFQNLPRSEQTCLCLLAKSQLIVAGNAAETTPVRAGHPNAKGFVQFDTLRRDVKTFVLDTPFGNNEINAFVAAVSGDEHARTQALQSYIESPEVKTAGATIIKWNTPDDELSGIARYLRSVIDEESVFPRDVCVVVPNRQWGHFAERALQAAGFSVSSSGIYAGIGGNPQNSERAAALVALTKLNLIADPQDLVAWRSWCGFDNKLTNSEMWDSLVTYAHDRNLDLYEALEAIGSETTSDTQGILRRETLVARWKSGQELITHAQSRYGFALLRIIGAETLSEFADVCRRTTGSESAAELHALARTIIDDPSFSSALSDVHIATYQTMPGTSYKIVVVLAAVDGLMPSRDAFEIVSTDDNRSRILNEARCVFYTAISKASDLLVVSTFSKASLELAERSKMLVMRVRSEQGERVASVRPTIFLSEAGAARPTTVGGQTLLSTLTN